jgi:branched-chain amino acid transport system permease protein
VWASSRDDVKRRFGALQPAQQRTARISGLGIALIVLCTLPLFIGPFLSQTLDLVGIYILLGLGLNIVVGFAGLLDLGYVAFYAVGAYATAVLTSPASPLFAPQLDFWVAVPLVLAITAFIGLAIGAPVLRLRGDYLAIVTLGFGEIARIIFNSNWMTPYLGGSQGILQVPPPEFLGISLRDPSRLYYPILVACIIAAIAAISLANSRVGRAWTAMREDESVAEATGVNTTKYKLLAFALGATFGGLAGALYAVRIGTVFPQELNIVVSINALALIILGGIGSIPGVIVGAIVLVGLPELLREFSEYRLLLYGIVLVAMMLLRPEGLLPNRSRRAELHEGEDDSEPDWDEKRWERKAGDETPEPRIST